jgi:hypothetical protein
MAESSRPKNIVIFSDGTGQRGGVLLDENRSNVYKLFRACKVAPDSTIDPREQVAYYDAGIGTMPPGTGFLGSIARATYNIISRARLGLAQHRQLLCCNFAILGSQTIGYS